MASRQGSPKASHGSHRASLTRAVTVLAPLACLLYACFSLGIYYGANEAERRLSAAQGLAAERQQHPRRSLRVRGGGSSSSSSSSVEAVVLRNTGTLPSSEGTLPDPRALPQQQQQQQQAAAGKRPAQAAAWLYTLVGSDYEGTAALLPHWLSHYLDTLGFSRERLLVVVNHNSSRPSASAEHERVLGVLADWGVPYRLWTDRYSSDAHLKVKLALLAERVTNLEDWISIADSDEFQSYDDVLGGGAGAGGAGAAAAAPRRAATITDAIAAAADLGANFVMGQMVDRVAPGGALAAVAPSPSLFRQFPLECQVVRRLTKGYTYKTVAFKAYWRTNTGNHFIVSPDRAQKYFSAAPAGAKNARGGWQGAEDLYALTPYSTFHYRYQYAKAPRIPVLYRPVQYRPILPVYHFKWHAGVLQSASDRYQHYKGNVTEGGGGLPRYNHYFESRNVLNSLKGGRINLEDAGCSSDGHSADQ